MPPVAPTVDELLTRARAGDAAALDGLFALCRSVKGDADQFALAASARAANVAESFVNLVQLWAALSTTR